MRDSTSPPETGCITGEPASAVTPRKKGNHRVGKGKTENHGVEPRDPRKAAFPVRFTATALLFGQDALDYDRRPEATSILDDMEVAALLKTTGNVACHPEWLAQIRSIITAFANLGKAQASWPKEKQRPEERIARAVGVLRSVIPLQIEKLEGEIQDMPVEFHHSLHQEIARLKRLLDAAGQEPFNPVEKAEGQISATDMVRLLAKRLDSIYGSGGYWKKSPKTLFLATAVRKAGWEITEGAIEQQLLYAARSSRTRK